MLRQCSFRAQLVLPGQRQLYDYWKRAAGERQMPARADFQPGQVPKLLPNIALIDLDPGLRDAKFRLAGTALRDVYGGEVTGRRLDQVFAGEPGEYWHRVHGSVQEHGAAMHGVVQGPADGREHVVLFWLRLPLAADEDRARFILCYDCLAPMPDLWGEAFSLASGQQAPSVLAKLA
ncbi:PAS domain-containing protein [Methyloligella sp. 2.7D]|uniref:PAS domain-containing protein n=1 Tax=unclassified Methyloligella TaxID=2625955 RepID=UPI00157CAA6D|nr:PAS domain-containing protein [Methyloligella sp. GL2]QKP77091.1 PAS domain-containing protein [Methyloligella sp. GL2]